MNRWIPFLFLGALAVAATRPLWWQPAPYWVLDDGFGHLFRVFEFDRVLHQGIVYPRWAPDLDYGYGYPVFNYYAPLIYFLTQALHLYGLIIPDAVKTLAVLTVVVAASGAYAMGTELFRDDSKARSVGLLTATAYVLFPYSLLNLYTRGAFADALAAAFVPWLVWSLRRALRSKTIPSLLLVAVFSALLVLTHNLTAFAAAPFVGAFLIWELAHLPPAVRFTALLRVVAAALIALLLTAIYWLPLVLEASLVAISREGSDLLTILGQNFVTLRDLIQLSWTYQYGVAPFQLALVPVLLAGVGLALAILTRRGMVIFWAALALVAMFFLTDASKGIWTSLPLLRSIQFPWRLSVFIGLSISIAIGSLAASVPSLRIFQPIDGDRARTLDLVAAGLVLIVAGELAWVGLANLAPKRLNNLTSVDVGQLVRYEADFSPGIGSMNEYLPLTVQSLPSRLNPVAKLNAIPAIRLEEYGATRRTFTVNATEPVSISLHAFYFPDWQATLDGTPVAAYPSRQMGLLTVDVPAGSHRFAIELEDTPARRLGAVLTSLGAAIFGALTIIALRRREDGTVAVLAVIALAAIAIAPTALTALSAAPPSLQPTDVSVSSELNLLGVHIDGAQDVSDHWQVAQKPAALNLQVYWQVKSSLAEGPTIWRLVDGNNKEWAKTEQLPRYAAGFPATWVPNEIVEDYYTLPLSPSMPQGRYVLEVSAGRAHDYAPVTTIELGQGSAPAAAEPQIAHRIDSRVGDAVDFVGYTAPKQVQAGEIAPVALYWKTTRSLPVDYTAFLQLIDHNGNLAAQDNGLAGERLNPTSLWAPGVIQTDWHDLALPGDILPGIYRLTAGLYLSKDVTRLPVINEAGEASPDDVVELGEIKIPMSAQPPPLPHPVDVSLGPAIRLAGYDLLTTAGNARLKLDWQARLPVNTDYKVFVHVLDANGKVAAQIDRLPTDGQYPTRIWDAGDSVVDSYSLPMSNLPAGHYRIEVGMYSPDSGIRLPTVDPNGRELPSDQFEVPEFDWHP